MLFQQLATAGAYANLFSVLLTSWYEPYLPQRLWKWLRFRRRVNTNISDCKADMTELSRVRGRGRDEVQRAACGDTFVQRHHDGTIATL